MSQITLSLSSDQRAFLDEIADKSNINFGELTWRALLYADKELISIDFLTDYIQFIASKEHGVRTYLQNRYTLQDDLKALSQSYKEIGYNIGIKGVVVLYVLYYASNKFDVDISNYKRYNV